MNSYLKLLSILLSAIFILSAVSLFSASAEGGYTQPEKFIYGDVNVSGTIDINDVSALQRYLNHEITLNNIQLFLADANYDGVVGIKDVTYIQRIISHIV